MDTEKLPSDAQAQEFDVVFPLLEAAYQEMKELSKKKPDAILTLTKLEMLNKRLERAKAVLMDQSTADYLETLSVEADNGDAVLTIGQHLEAMRMFRERFKVIIDYKGHRAWSTRENPQQSYDDESGAYYLK